MKIKCADDSPEVVYKMLLWEMWIDPAMRALLHSPQMQGSWLIEEKAVFQVDGAVSFLDANEV